MAFSPDSRSSLFLALSALVSCSSAATADRPPNSPGASGSASAGGSGSGAGPDAGGGSVSSDGGEPPAVGGASAAGAAGGSRSVSGAGGADGTSAPVPLVYVGSTNGQISIFTLDAALGKLTLVKSVAAGN